MLPDLPAFSFIHSERIGRASTQFLVALADVHNCDGLMHFEYALGGKNVTLKIT